MLDTIRAIPEALGAAAVILVGIPPSVWGPLIILCGFGLAAFAIYAVLSISKGRS